MIENKNNKNDRSFSISFSFLNEDSDNNLCSSNAPSPMDSSKSSQCLPSLPEKKIKKKLRKSSLLTPLNLKTFSMAMKEREERNKREKLLSDTPDAPNLATQDYQNILNRVRAKKQEKETKSKV